MPAIGVCLLSGIVDGCAYRWTPPEIPIQPADTTALGVRADLPLVAMWPGESRRIALPVVKSKPTSPRAFVLRGGDQLSFRLDNARIFSPVIQGAMMSIATPDVCVLRVDSLATPGDTISAIYTVSTTTEPPRYSRWRLRVVVEMPPLVVDGFGTGVVDVAAHPNPFNPQTTMCYVISSPGRVTLEIYDVHGARVATLIDSDLRAGAYTTTWDARNKDGADVGSGIYFGRLTSSAGVKSYKMTIVK
jgi:hypothetical protein